MLCRVPVTEVASAWANTVELEAGPWALPILVSYLQLLFSASLECWKASRGVCMVTVLDSISVGRFQGFILRNNLPDCELLFLFLASPDFPALWSFRCPHMIHFIPGEEP